MKKVVRIENRSDLDRLALAILMDGKGLRRVSILTGAGVSAVSGLPDLLGPNHAWAGVGQEGVLTAEGMRRDPHAFTSLARRAIAAVQAHKHNLIHELLAHLQATGIIRHLVTLTVDGYHREAGSEAVLALRGDMLRIRCDRCMLSATRRKFLVDSRCGCGGFLRPDVVFIDEPVPDEALGRILDDTELLVLAGTPRDVAPVPSLIGRPVPGVEVAVLAEESDARDTAADFRVYGPLDDLIEALYRRLYKFDRSRYRLAPIEAFI